MPNCAILIWSLVEEIKKWEKSLLAGVEEFLGDRVTKGPNEPKYVFYWPAWKCHLYYFAFALRPFILKYTGSGTSLPGFQTWLNHLLAIWSWAT